MNTNWKREASKELEPLEDDSIEELYRKRASARASIVSIQAMLAEEDRAKENLEEVRGKVWRQRTADALRHYRGVHMMLNAEINLIERYDLNILLLNELKQRVDAGIWRVCAVAAHAKMKEAQDNAKEAKSQD
jgi:hypothetical protein